MNAALLFKEALLLNYLLSVVRIVCPLRTRLELQAVLVAEVTQLPVEGT